MDILIIIIKWLTEESFSVNHVIVAFFVVFFLADDRYIEGAITWIFGVIYCTLMNKLVNRPMG